MIAENAHRPRWEWSLVLVVCLHLLSTAGAWWITDHGEILAVADNLLTNGRLDLHGLRPGWEQWAKIASARGTEETRFAPLSIASLVPFLVLDRAFGWGDPGRFRVVYLQGHLFVTLGLFLIGRHARNLGSAEASSLTIWVLGLVWPVWMIARRLGPEPVLFFLLALFAVGTHRWRALARFLLPWTHASGPVLGLAAVLSAIRSERVLSLALAWTGGVASVLAVWNLGVHGHLLMGGYARYSGDTFFVMRDSLTGFLATCGTFILWTLPIWIRGWRAGREAWIGVAAGVGIPMALLALSSNPEPERRLAATLALVGGVFAGAALPRPAAMGAASLGALLSGVLGLSRDFVDSVETPLGLFSGPKLFWLHLLAERPTPVAWMSFLALCAATTLAARRVLALYGRRVTAVSISSDE